MLSERPDSSEKVERDHLEMLRIDGWPDGVTVRSDAGRLYCSSIGSKNHPTVIVSGTILNEPTKKELSLTLTQMLNELLCDDYSNLVWTSERLLGNYQLVFYYENRIIIFLPPNSSFLYWSENRADMEVAFRSDARAFESPRVSEPMVDHFLSRSYLPPGRSLFENIYTLLPGSITTIDQSLNINSTLLFKHLGRERNPTMDDFKRATLKVLTEYLNHFNERLCVLFSGGIDSAMVCAALKHLKADFIAGVAIPKTYDWANHQADASLARDLSERLSLRVNFVEVDHYAPTSVEDYIFGCKKQALKNVVYVSIHRRVHNSLPRTWQEGEYCVLSGQNFDTFYQTTQAKTRFLTSNPCYSATESDMQEFIKRLVFSKYFNKILADLSRGEARSLVNRVQDTIASSEENDLADILINTKCTTNTRSDLLMERWSPEDDTSIFFKAVKWACFCTIITEALRALNSTVLINESIIANTYLAYDSDINDMLTPKTIYEDLFRDLTGFDYQEAKRVSEKRFNRIDHSFAPMQQSDYHKMVARYASALSGFRLEDVVSNDILKQTEIEPICMFRKAHLEQYLSHDAS